MAEDKTPEVEEKSSFDFKIIVAGLIIFLLAMGASYFLMKSLMAPLLPKEETEQKEVLTGNLVEVGEFTTNIGDVNGSRFVKVEVFVEVTGKKGQETIAEFMPIIKDSILTILSSKTVADLDVRNWGHLKEEIKNELNSKLGKNTIKSVYFGNFIMQ
ncbi:MAG TPA: flagellar basal body-associated FliL family protein [Syntrophomonadaceae bacterium]|nr:flagellar basal body-associated FliL family protein [Syntrophomonadaceae bacterium]